MLKVRYKGMVLDIRGTMDNMVFKRSPRGKTIVTKKPDMSKVKWSKAQKDHRKKMRRANDYAAAAMADPTVSAIYEKIARKEHRQPFRVAVSDYYKGKNLLSQPNASADERKPRSPKVASE